jgi:hypothetical protein
MKMTEATPRPYYVLEEQGEPVRIVDVQDVTVAVVPQQPLDTWQAVDTANLIVEAVNAHDALVAALDDLIGVGAWLTGAISKGIHVTNDALVLMEDELEKARAALTLAKEE